LVLIHTKIIVRSAPAKKRAFFLKKGGWANISLFGLHQSILIGEIGLKYFIVALVVSSKKQQSDWQTGICRPAAPNSS